MLKLDLNCDLIFTGFISGYLRFSEIAMIDDIREGGYTTHTPPVVTVGTFFLETWRWDLVEVG